MNPKFRQQMGTQLAQELNVPGERQKPSAGSLERSRYASEAGLT